mmetsp:Transcript_48795/g.119481  ORF Transcript_48795/g.119481 Transcript_48795/m.119481 type:complete len:440 (+) Transcript_48795:107-1426(+)
MTMLMLATAVAMAAAVARAGAIPDEAWSYVDVRDDARMFYWLMGKQGAGRESAPLVLWLQGGPGGSSTGFGNFGEIGPLDVSLQPRAQTWLRDASLLFIDNPVGTGYSYVSDKAALARNESQIVADLLVVLGAFVAKHPPFATLPLYVFSESYGGKMTASLGVGIVDAVRGGKLRVNLAGVALGDSWVSPIDYVAAWATFLEVNSQIDAVGASRIAVEVNKTRALIAAGRWKEATSAWGDVEQEVETNSCGVNFYNIATVRASCDNKNRAATLGERLQARALAYVQRHSNARSAAVGEPDLGALMNGQIKKKLGIPDDVTWGAQAGDVFEALSGDFMRPVVAAVDELLARGVKVTVYQGAVDLICCSPATRAWMSRLTWPQLPKFNAAPRTAIVADNHALAFVKRYRNLAYIDVMNAGHMVPADQPVAARAVLHDVLSH